MALLELPTIGRDPASPALIDGLLAEQQRLTAVERFAQLHEAEGSDRSNVPRFYRDLLPLTALQAGEQYAFTVDLDACSGCKACVTACHSLNGLDESETFRDVGALVGRDRGGLHVLQHVTTACHHCLEPACLAGCPTLAYDKDPQTGIVRHLDDQCVGCQYCTLMCPYDVPKYNAAKGIVRKCDMCRQRLEDGEAPACVQACPNQAIRIEVVARADARQRGGRGEFLPLAPDPRLTLPTTRFISNRQLRDVAAAGAGAERPAHGHLPLVVMLVLTQMSVGMFGGGLALLLFGTNVAPLIVWAAAIGLLGLQAAVLHLGRPTIAWKAWLGWRTSWLSREVIAFAAYSFLAATSAGVALSDAPGNLDPSNATFGSRQLDRPYLLPIALLATTIGGGVAVFCSAMIYVATRREFWSAGRTVPRFFITVLLLGFSGTIAIQAATYGAAPAPWQWWLLGLLTLARFCLDSPALRQPEMAEVSPLAQAAGLIMGPLDNWHTAQAMAAVVGGVVLPLAAVAIPAAPPSLTAISLALLLAAEFIQRWIFFAAASAPRMPGVSHA